MGSLLSSQGQWYCPETTCHKLVLSSSPQTGGVGSFDIAGLLNNPSFMSMVTAFIFPGRIHTYLPDLPRCCLP